MCTYVWKDITVDFIASEVVVSWPDEEDMNRSYKLPLSTYIGGKQTSLSLSDIITRLENAYCRSIGALLPPVIININS